MVLTAVTLVSSPWCGSGLEKEDQKLPFGEMKKSWARRHPRAKSRLKEVSKGCLILLQMEGGLKLLGPFPWERALVVIYGHSQPLRLTLSAALGSLLLCADTSYMLALGSLMPLSHPKNTSLDL